MGLRRDTVQESRLGNQADMELEYNDALRASRVTLKFVAFKTPTSGTALPTSLFFTFKFFNNPACQTEPAQLHTSDQAIKLATQYYLVLPDTLRLLKQGNKPDFETVLDSALQ